MLSSLIKVMGRKLLMAMTCPRYQTRNAASIARVPDVLVKNNHEWSNSQRYQVNGGLFQGCIGQHNGF